jgi:FkbM family methyltransferase
LRLRNQKLFFRLNHRIFPLLYLGQQGRRHVVYRVNDSTRFKLRVNSSDKLVLWEVWKLREYDRPGFPIGPADVVLDIGAHIGTFAVLAAKRARKGMVIACEPFKENYDLLLDNLRLNRVDNFTALNVAVGDRNGKRELKVPAFNGALGSFFQEGSERERFGVDSIMLDSLIEDQGLEEVDVLKIDVEGAEYPILFGTSRRTLRRIRRIILEYHDFEESEYHHKDLEKYLKHNGFKIAASPRSFLYGLLFGTGIIHAWRADS